MAKNINETGNNVRQLNPRKPGAGRKVAASAAAAAKADEMMGAKPSTPALGELPESAPPVTAPSFGANEPDCGVFLREVQKIRRQMDEVEDKKLALKTEKGKLKDIRKLAAGVGLVMREVDEAIDALNTEHVDLIAREARRRLYFEWLGLPLGAQASLPGVPVATDTEHEQARWRKRGDIAGRLAEERKLPEGCPGHCVQPFLEGWDAGHTAFMQGSPLTRDAFDKKGDLKPTAAAAPPPAGSTILVFSQAHFATGTGLEDANLKTLLEEHAPAFHAAERVVALFGTRRRVLREPNGDGTFYVDTGESDAEITEPEEVTAADVALAPTASDFG